MPANPSRFLFLAAVCLLFCGVAAGQEQPPPEFAFAVSSSITPFPFAVIDVEYSSALNAIVAVAESPNQLHLYYPDTNTFAAVNLQLPPRCVSVSPDGTEAVVGHNAFVSHVDLAELALLKTIAVSANVGEIVHGGNGFAYLFASGSNAYSVNLTTDAVSSSYSWRTAYAARLHPAGDRIYGADRNVSPADLLRFDIGDDGELGPMSDSVYHGDYSFCGDVWPSADGLRLFTACGNVFRASNDPSTDMRYNGKLSQETSIRWATHSLPGNSIAVLPNSVATDRVRYYTHDFLLYRGHALLPPFQVENTSWPARGRWIFFNAAGTKQYVVVQADAGSGILHDYGLVTIDCTNPAVSFNPAAASIGAGAGSSQVALIGSAGCGWKAISNAAWLTTISSGIGDGTVTFTATANTSANPRSGTITVGNATLTVTQAAPIPLTIIATATSPTSVAVLWTATASVDHYEVFRNDGSGFELIGTSATTNYTESLATANSAFLYAVRAIVTGGGATAMSVPDYAHTFSYTDSLLAAGVAIKAAHVEQLRMTVNALRTVAGLAPAAFTDATLTGVEMKHVHITEVRTALNEVRSTLALPVMGFSALAPGSVVAAVYTNELRTGLQ